MRQDKGRHIGSQIARGAMTGGVLGTVLVIGWSLFDTVVRDQWMCGHLVPAAVAAVIGCIVGTVVGACVGLVVACVRQPRPHGQDSTE
jgi:hypothetical protein